MDPKEISKMTNESTSKAVELKYNKIKFNGRDGKFKKTCLLEQKKEDERYNVIDLGKKLEVVFLKHRRILTADKPQKPIQTTSEHNRASDYVILYNAGYQQGVKDYGQASELREKYDELRTNQIVYCYVPELKEVVKLVIKGASLGSKSKPDGVLSYYDYLSSFKSDDQHSWQYTTILEPVTEQGPMGSYYAISFKRGDKLDETKLNKVASLISEIHQKTQDYDAAVLNRLPAGTVKDPEEQEAQRVQKYRKDVAQIEEKNRTAPKEDVIEYPSEEINPEDIPF